MIHTCRFKYAVSETSHVVDERSDIWANLLPATRHGEDPGRLQATVGHYFQAATEFLSHHDFKVITTGARVLCGRSMAAREIDNIRICLVKHGTFYHPSQVTVTAKDSSVFHMALNLAVSPQGIQCIDREFAAIESLSRRTSHIPILIGKGEVTTGDGIVCSMFAAQWFDDYHEFHISLDKNEPSVVVWDGSRGHYFLSDQEIGDLYRQAAFIMTCCYNPRSCELIQPWHHAAGDFVVRRDDEGLHVRLITVRQYTSMAEDIPDDPEILVDAALIFLIGLSIRMRLDRVDGIKDTAWAKDLCVPAVVRGFYEGLVHSAPEWVAPFNTFVSDLDESDLMERAHMVIGAYHPDAPDLAVILPRLDEHMILMARALKTQDHPMNTGHAPR